MTSPPGAILFLRSGVTDPGQVKLENQVHRLGRSPHEDIGLDNPYVSNDHAEITYTDSGYTIRDLGSRNGTIVDGTRLDDRPCPLRGGEIIEFAEGQVIATFSVDRGTLTIPNAARETPGVNPATPATTGSSAQHGLFVDVGAREVYVDGELVVPRCSKKQFDILILLYEKRGQACSKDEIASAGWPERLDGGVSDAEIGANMFRIRGRVEPDPGAPRFIETIPGYGYRMNVEG